jgi:hypothetical protein
VLIGVPKAKDLGQSVAIDDATIQQVMDVRSDLLWLEHRTRRDRCRGPGICRWASGLAGTPTGLNLVGRLFISSVTHPDGMDIVWPDVVGFVSAHLDSQSSLLDSLTAFTDHGGRALIVRRSRMLGWGSADTNAITASFLALTDERIASGEQWLAATEVRRRFAEDASRLLRRPHDFYPLCTEICGKDACRYRAQVQDVLVSPRHSGFPSEPSKDAAGGAYMLEVAAYAANDVVVMGSTAPTGSEALNAARWQAIGCAGQVKFCGDDQPTQAAAILRREMTAAGWRPVTVAADEPTRSEQ